MIIEANGGLRYSEISAMVLGASGFIGRWVASALCAQGARVILVVRNRSALEAIAPQYAIQGEIIEQNLSDYDALYRILHQVRPSITFNLVGYGIDSAERDQTIAHRINAELITGLCEAVAGSKDSSWHGQDIIHAGSALEYGQIGGDLDEDSVPNPTTTYGKSKLVGARLLSGCCRAYGIQGLTARLFTVYGPGEHPDRLLPSLQRAARTGEPLGLTAGTQQRDFVYVEDVAEALLRLGLAQARPGEIVNVATGVLTSVRRFAETAAEELGIPPSQLLFGKIPIRPNEMRHLPVRLSRLRALVGWLPSTGIVQGIRNTIEFEGGAVARPPMALS